MSSLDGFWCFRLEEYEAWEAKFRKTVADNMQMGTLDLGNRLLT